METLANLESFVKSAETSSFSEAARRLSLTPAAVSRNVAMLERNLGVRLFHRSTRKLTLTEAGEHFLGGIGDTLEKLQAAIAGAASDSGEPAGTLKVSVSLAFGMEYILPLLPPFLEQYPSIKVDWHFDNRQVDLVAEGFDAAIGGGFELSPSIIARPLAPAHIVAVASPAYMDGKRPPSDPSDLAEHDGIVMRSSNSGRIRHWSMRDASGRQMLAEPRETVVLSDPAPIVRAAALDLGVALVALPDALPYLERGELIRLLPRWYADAGGIFLYYASRALQPAKTSAFVEHVMRHFQRERLAERFAGSLG